MRQSQKSAFEPSRPSNINNEEVTYIKQKDLKAIPNPGKEFDIVLNELISENWEG
jgi:hypothetical protein